jgi:hypothetical protein
MTTTQEPKLYFNGQQVQPSYKKLATGQISWFQITAPKESVNTVIDSIVDRGASITELFIWIDDVSNQNITVKINGSAARKVSPIIKVSGAITSFTFSNSSTTTDIPLNIGFQTE